MLFHLWLLASTLATIAVLLLALAPPLRYRKNRKALRRAKLIACTILLLATNPVALIALYVAINL
jgi:hypothetical protein